MNFKIVSAGWQCAQFMERTFESVESQTLKNWTIGVVYDPSDDDGAQRIEAWCAKDPERRLAVINTEQRWATRNQYETLVKLEPEDDDIIIFLDLDGDMLAHPEVLEKLRDAYEEGALLTYGQYKPVPDEGTSTYARLYPGDVIAANSYRAYHLHGGDTCFNHLRTMSGSLFKAMPLEMFKWQQDGEYQGPNGWYIWKAGDWYRGSTDYIFMINALELANGKVKCFDEVLLHYNHANPLADNKVHPGETHCCLIDFFGRTPLMPLSEKTPTAPPSPDPEPVATPVKQVVPFLYPMDERSFGEDYFLTADQRREIIIGYAQANPDLKVFIETGTNNGDTPWAVKNYFEELYTIELDVDLYEEADKRFIKDAHIHCIFGDSSIVLSGILTLIDQPSLVWLDGHFCGPGSAHAEDSSTPIREELRILLTDRHSHMILIDDARIFEGGPEHEMYDHYAYYPSLQWVHDLAIEHHYSCELQDDIIRLTPLVGDNTLTEV